MNGIVNSSLKVNRVGEGKPLARAGISGYERRKPGPTWLGESDISSVDIDIAKLILKQECRYLDLLARDQPS